MINNSTNLTLPHVCACPKTRTGFPTSYVMIFFVFSEFSSDGKWLFVLLILVELMIITVLTGFSSGHEELFFLRLSELNFFVYIKSCQYSMFYTDKTGFSSGHEEFFFLRLSELNFFVYIKSCQYSMFYTNKTGFSSGHEELFFLRLSELNFFVYIKSCQYSMLYTNKMFWTRSQV